MTERTEVTPARASTREWIGLAVIALPCLLYSMDLTVLHLAVPRLSEDLKPSSTQLLWIIDIYGFFVAGSLITLGTLGDRIGRRRLLLIGAAFFGVASVLAAFSRSAPTLIASRALLGVAGATVAPSTLSLIRNMFLDAHQRTVAVSVWIMSFSLGSAVGPLIGGILLEYFWWGSVFLIAVPVMALLLLVGPRLLPEYRDPNAGRPDVTSAVLSLVAVLSMIYGLKQIAQDGVSLAAVAFIIGGVAIGVVFVRRQRILADPLIDLRLFRVPGFSASLALYGLTIMVLFGGFFFLPQYLQLVLGLSPFKSGLWTLPWGVAFIVGSLATPPIARRTRPAVLMSIGLAVAAAGYWMLTRVGTHSGFALFAVATVVFSLGVSPVFTLTNDLIIGSAPPERAGAASGISETCAEFGGALSIAVFGSIGVAIYRGVLGGAMPAGLPPEVTKEAMATLGGAVVTARQLPVGVGTALVDAAREAFLRGLRLCAAISAAGSIALAIFAARAFRHVRPASERGA
ncbi:MAG TPA: MFS transporter [Gemmatimonadaceae bacterium]|jgi:DHA2 family multidrug resistance protein-like MFS transporter